MVINPYTDFPQNLPSPNVIEYNPVALILISVAVVIIISFVITAIVISKKRKNK